MLSVLIVLSIAALTIALIYLVAIRPGGGATSAPPASPRRRSALTDLDADLNQLDWRWPRR
jgi:hypothetical protein